MPRTISYFLILFLVSGCTATRPSHRDQETSEDVTRALGSVADALTGEELSDEELKRLSREIENDPEAQSAIQAVSDSVSGQVHIKYCPVDGRRYSARLEKCPEHQVPLKPVE